MIKLKLWDKKTPLIYGNGALAEPVKVVSEYPFAQFAPTVLEVIGEVEAGIMIGAIDNLYTLRQVYGIDPSLDDGQAVAAIEVIRNTPQEVSASAEERIAAALEFQTLMALPDNM